jgi:hypothetical protein
VIHALTRAWRNYRSLPLAKREAATFGISILFALTILQFAIWIAGQVFLGDYLRDAADPNLDPDLIRRGGPFALILDFVRGLFSGSPGHWLVLLGPYGLLWAYRLIRRLA